METLLIGLIICIAAVYAGMTFYQKYKQGKSIAEKGGCSSCSLKGNCGEIGNPNSHTDCHMGQGK